LRIEVRNNDVGQALRVLKRKLQKEGVFKEMRARTAYEKPSERRRRERGEAVRRWKKAERKRLEREGF
jgi:small subunit ribosomal protein S21